MEARSYSALPVGTNFLIAGYGRVEGHVSFDPALPVSNVTATINHYDFAYLKSFDLFGRTATAAMLLPLVQGEIAGQLQDQTRSAARSGLGDMAFRFTTNLIGGPALTPAEFAQRERDTAVGASLVVVAPTGQNDPQRLINIGNHRWAFKPGIGVTQPFGNWFTEASVASWLFTDNTNFFGGHDRGQGPIVTLEGHAGYDFRPGLWLSFDATYYRGGETSVDGLAKNDPRESARYGLTLSVPIVPGFSAKAYASNWLSHSNTGTYQAFGISLQFRWFDD
jgi:hypothetical protein